MQQYILAILQTVISGVLLATCKGLLDENKRIRQQKAEEDQRMHDAVVQSIIQLLRIQLCEYHAKYSVEGIIPTYVYDNWCRMYEQYKTLGGNGMVTHMNEDIEALHMKNK